MHPFPHRYSVNAIAAPAGVVTLRGSELEDIQSTAPPEFGGPPGSWSPETLLVAAAADCLVLNFRAIAAASKLEWLELDCAAHGTLERTPDGIAFVSIDLDVRLRLPPAADKARAERLMEKAEQTCPVSLSLKTPVQLHLRIE
jgi:organic hydroperoxide reductase OsmC/OhrA